MPRKPIISTCAGTDEEPLHHVCLMYGVKQTYGRMPFLNKKVLEEGGKRVTIDNVVAPPPTIKDSDRGTDMREMRNMVSVSYWKNKLENLTAFVNNLIEDYLQFRHPFMKIAIKTDGCYDKITGHSICQIL